MKTTILAGKFKGYSIGLPPLNITRPVSAKVRSAIFNTLGDIKGLRVLDLYAGAGTLGLEAISRGAISVTFVDSNKDAMSMIKKNIKRLTLDNQTNVVRKDVKKFLESDTNKYNLVFFDPPYAEFNINLVRNLVNLVKLGGIIVLSCSVRTNYEALDSLERLKTKIYGDTKIIYLRKT